jgi:hypothetical protein
MPTRKLRIKFALSFCCYMNNAQSLTLLHILVYIKPTALFFLPLYSDLNTHNILQIKPHTRAHSFQHLAAVQKSNDDMYKWMEQVDCPVICCSVYVYIQNHVPPRTLRHTLKTARSHPGNRSWSSTLPQLRQHEPPFLVRSSRRQGKSKKYPSPYIAYCSLIHRQEPVFREERCVSKYSIKEQAQNHMVKRFTSAKFIHVPSRIISAKYQAWQTSWILFPLQLLPSKTAMEIEDICAKIMSQTCFPKVPGWNTICWSFSAFVVSHSTQIQGTYYCYMFHFLRVHQIIPLRSGKPNKTILKGRPLYSAYITGMSCVFSSRAFRNTHTVIRINTNYWCWC